MTDRTRTAPHPLAALFGRVTMTARPVALAEVVKRWRHRHQSRIALSQLSDFHLHDIGLDPMIRDQEAGRPFWK